LTSFADRVLKQSVDAFCFLSWKTGNRAGSAEQDGDDLRLTLGRSDFGNEASKLFAGN
jgi:hypothetical protein